MSDDEDNGECKTDRSGSSTAGKKNDRRLKKTKIEKKVEKVRNNCGLNISKMTPTMLMKSMRSRPELKRLKIMMTKMRMKGGILGPSKTARPN